MKIKILIFSMLFLYFSFAYAKKGCEAYLVNIGPEYVVFNHDFKADPDLASWLKKSREKYSKIENPLEVAADLTNYFRKNWGPGFSLSESLLNLKRSIWYYWNFESRTKSLEARRRHYDKKGRHFEVFKAGDFLRNCMGVCRHRALILAETLNDLGFKAFYVTGDIRVLDVDDKLIEPGSAHAWVFLEAFGSRYLFDPSISPVPNGIKVPPIDRKLPFINRFEVPIVEGKIRVKYIWDEIENKDSFAKRKNLTTEEMESALKGIAPFW